MTITAQIPNHVNESSSSYSGSVEFRTLPPRILSIPLDLSIEKDLVEPDTWNLSWKPVCTMSNTVSNGVTVGGYSVYLDGVRVHQILNPIGKLKKITTLLRFSLL